MKRNQVPAPSCSHPLQLMCLIRHEGLQSRWWGNERVYTIRYEPGTVQYTTAILPVQGPCAGIIACRNPLYTRSTSDHVTPSQSRVLNPQTLSTLLEQEAGQKSPIIPPAIPVTRKKHRVGSIWLGKSVRLRKGHPANNKEGGAVLLGPIKPHRARLISNWPGMKFLISVDRSPRPFDFFLRNWKDGWDRAWIC